MVYPEEREAWINVDYYGKTVNVYTNNSTVIKRIIARGLYRKPDGSIPSAEEVERMEDLSIRGLDMDEMKHFAIAGIFKAE